MHAKPSLAGGPPEAQFPILGWAIGAVAAPVALLLIVHLSGLWVSNTLERERQPAHADRAVLFSCLPSAGIRRSLYHCKLICPLLVSDVMEGIAAEAPCSGPRQRGDSLRAEPGMLRSACS